MKEEEEEMGREGSVIRTNWDGDALIRGCAMRVED